jgi:DNA anti-recombination protein RmuC
MMEKVRAKEQQQRDLELAKRAAIEKLQTVYAQQRREQLRQQEQLRDQQEKQRQQEQEQLREQDQLRREQLRQQEQQRQDQVSKHNLVDLEKIYIYKFSRNLN